MHTQCGKPRNSLSIKKIFRENSFLHSFFFSGYTSISVREPLRHIRPNPPSNTMPNVSNSNYAPVSEASDDMYAAIEDPTYIPTGK